MSEAVGASELLEGALRASKCTSSRSGTGPPVKRPGGGLMAGRASRTKAEHKSKCGAVASVFYLPYNVKEPLEQSRDAKWPHLASRDCDQAKAYGHYNPGAAWVDGTREWSSGLRHRRRLSQWEKTPNPLRFFAGRVF